MAGLQRRISAAIFRGPAATGNDVRFIFCSLFKPRCARRDRGFLLLGHWVHSDFSCFAEVISPASNSAGVSPPTSGFWPSKRSAPVEGVLPPVFMPAMPRQLRQESSIHSSAANTDSPLNDNKSARAGHAFARRRGDRDDVGSESGSPRGTRGGGLRSPL